MAAEVTPPTLSLAIHFGDEVAQLCRHRGVEPIDSLAEPLLAERTNLIQCNLCLLSCADDLNAAAPQQDEV